VLTRFTSAQQILGENAQLSARLKLAEHIAAEHFTQLEALKKELDQVKAERARYCERAVLLEEELRWIKSQYFGSVSQKQDAATVNPDQPMLFNEAEVLTAIAAAEVLSSAPRRSAHERNILVTRRPALPAHPYRARSPEQQKLCTKCPTPHPLARIGHERRVYRFEPQISVESTPLDVRRTPDT
jgi:hypothetical protein